MSETEALVTDPLTAFIDVRLSIMKERMEFHQLMMEQLRGGVLELEYLRDNYAAAPCGLASDAE